MKKEEIAKLIGYLTLAVIVFVHIVWTPIVMKSDLDEYTAQCDLKFGAGNWEFVETSLSESFGINKNNSTWWGLSKCVKS